MHNAKRLDRLYLQVLSTVDRGTQLELLQADANGNLVDDPPYPLATIRADDNENLLLELYTLEGTFRIPICEVERAFQVSREKVHPEEHYETKTNEEHNP